MQRRAAMKSTLPGRRQATDARHADGDVIQTMWTPQLASMAKTAKAPQSESDPLGIVTQLLREFGAAGAVTATGATTPHSLTGDRGREFYPDLSSHTRGPGKSKRKGWGKGKGQEVCSAQGQEKRKKNSSNGSESPNSEGGGGAGSDSTGGGRSSKRRKLRSSSASDSSTGARIRRSRVFAWSGAEFWSDEVNEEPGAVAEALANAAEDRANAARDRVSGSFASKP